LTPRRVTLLAPSASPESRTFRVAKGIDRFSVTVRLSIAGVGDAVALGLEDGAAAIGAEPAGVVDCGRQALDASIPPTATITMARLMRFL
jgi:hypothetical protein